MIFKAYVCAVLHSPLIHAFFSLNLLNSASTFINITLSLRIFLIYAFLDTAECWLLAIYYNLTVFRTKLVNWFHYCIPWISCFCFWSSTHLVILTLCYERHQMDSAGTKHILVFNNTCLRSSTLLLPVPGNIIAFLRRSLRGVVCGFSQCRRVGVVKWQYRLKEKKKNRVKISCWKLNFSQDVLQLRPGDVSLLFCGLKYRIFCLIVPSSERKRISKQKRNIFQQVKNEAEERLEAIWVDLLMILLPPRDFSVNVCLCMPHCGNCSWNPSWKSLFDSRAQHCKAGSLKWDERSILQLHTLVEI